MLAVFKTGGKQYSVKLGQIVKVEKLQGKKGDNVSFKEVLALISFSESIGVAFQIQDDLIEAEGDEDMIGKSVESDKSKNKAAYPILFGINESKKRVKELYESGCDSLKVFGESSNALREMAEIIIHRKL